MAKPSNQKRRRRRAQSPLLGMAVSLLGLGIFLMLLSGFFRTQVWLASAGAGVYRPAWWALALGAALLAVHLLLPQRSRAQVGSSHRAPKPRLPPRPTASPAALKALIDDVEGQVALSPIMGGTPTPGAVAARVAPAPTPRTSTEAGATDQATRWGPGVFAAIEWRRFEAVCEALFGQAGFETRAQSHGADGGVDIWLQSKHAKGPVAVVQCKHWKARPVGVNALREFYGVMASHGLKRGTYATTSTYTPDALGFAKAHGINALDGSGLLALIARRTPEQQAALLAVAYEGEYGRPTCANCGIKLVERSPAKGGPSFWGCRNYPRCKTLIHRGATA